MDSMDPIQLICLSQKLKYFSSLIIMEQLVDKLINWWQV